jgi:hypothetical protein
MRRFMVCKLYQIRVVISKMRWARHVARIEEKINAQKILARKPEVKRQLEKLRAGGKMLLKRTLRK